MNNEQPVYLDEENVLRYLSWDTLIPAIEDVLSDITNKDETQSIQPPRLVMPIPQRLGAVLSMPSFSGKRNILGSKVISCFRKNTEKGIPSTNGTILLMNSETGKVKMILEGNEITGWRTAAVSVVGTKHLHKGEKKVLAILGAGVQGKSHALAMRHYFQFPEVRIWNRTYDRAVALCTELGPWAKSYESIEPCVRGADVVVTATFAPDPIVDIAWLKPGTHINAVGFGKNHYSELPLELYKRSTVIIDFLASATMELEGLVSEGVELFCEVGEVIRGVRQLPETKSFTIFQALGMSLEDIAAAEIIYQQFIKSK